MASVWIGTPATRDFSPYYINSLWQSRIKGNAAWDAVYGQAIDIGRNEVCRRYLKSPLDFLLMHDSDATWHPDAIQRMMERNLPVVTGVIFKRQVPTLPTIGKHVSIGPAGEHFYNFSETINRIMQRTEIETREGNLKEDSQNELLFPRRPDDLQEIDGAGAHMMLIRRDVIEKIGYPWFECTSTNGGEDFDFCRKVQAAGFQMYVDYSIFTGHVVGPGCVIGLKEFLSFYSGKPLELVWSA